VPLPKSSDNPLETSVHREIQTSWIQLLIGLAVHRMISVGRTTLSVLSQQRLMKIHADGVGTTNIESEPTLDAGVECALRVGRIKLVF
jgi:hypothetical protein